MTQANRGAEQRAEGRMGPVQDVVDSGEVGTGVIVAGRRSTGEGEWAEDIKTLMRERPLLGAALMIGVGYAVARFLRR